MNEIQCWRFLVSRNLFLDYRTVVAPDFMCQANITSLLAKSAEGDLTYKNNAYYREIHGSKTGDLTLIYRISEAQANYINPEAEGVLKDSFGREIFFIEGIVVASNVVVARARKIFAKPIGFFQPKYARYQFHQHLCTSFSNKKALRRFFLITVWLFNFLS